MRFTNVAHKYINNINVENSECSKVSVRLKMNFHRRQTCTKRLSKPKFVNCCACLLACLGFWPSERSVAVTSHFMHQARTSWTYPVKSKASSQAMHVCYCVIMHDCTVYM